MREFLHSKEGFAYLRKCVNCGISLEAGYAEALRNGAPILWTICQNGVYDVVTRVTTCEGWIWEINPGGGWITAECYSHQTGDMESQYDGNPVFLNDWVNNDTWAGCSYDVYIIHPKWGASLLKEDVHDLYRLLNELPSRSTVRLRSHQTGDLICTANAGFLCRVYGQTLPF